MTLNITSHFEFFNDGGDRNNSFSFVFTFEIEGFKSKCYISEPYIYSPAEWQSMCDAIEKKTPRSLDFYMGNGRGSMDCNGNELIFTAEPSGSGGDVECSITLPLDRYGLQIIEKIKELIDNPEIRSCWV